jgi:hypothetical protein
MIREIKHLPAKTGPKEIDPAQGRLDLHVDKQTEIQGIEMGVLSDGTPFLTQRGLARLCGVQNAHIGTIGTEWDEEIQKATYLDHQGTVVGPRPNPRSSLF